MPLQYVREKREGSIVSSSYIAINNLNDGTFTGICRPLTNTATGFSRKCRKVK
jgi:hypothetical protein